MHFKIVLGSAYESNIHAPSLLNLLNSLGERDKIVFLGQVSSHKIVLYEDKIFLA